MHIQKYCQHAIPIYNIYLVSHVHILQTSIITITAREIAEIKRTQSLYIPQMQKYGTAVKTEFMSLLLILNSPILQIFVHHIFNHIFLNTLFTTMDAAKASMYQQKLQRIQVRFVKFCNSEHTERFMSLFCRWKLPHLLSVSYLANQWQSKQQLSQHKFHVQTSSVKNTMHFDLVCTQKQQKAVDWTLWQSSAGAVLMHSLIRTRP